VLVMQRGKTVELLAAEDLAQQRVTQDYTRRLMQACAGFQRVT
jgi:peptide/nickel transport system ATP-binding protein